MEPINDESLIWCGSLPLPTSVKATYKKTVELNAYPKSGNVHLKYIDVSSRLAQNLPPIAKDMLEIASYVYSADQAITRGGLALRGDGVGWRRNFRFNIPVRELDIWNSTEVQKLLTETLGFLSDDKYEFEFTKLVKDIPYEEFFDFHEETPFFEAEEVVLFSGGLDSLAGAIDEMKNNNRKVVLVSHRPAGKIHARQRGLLWELKRLDEYRSRFFHVPVCINKDSGLTNDTNQRTRSFLYVMIAASVALMFKIDEIRFFENGVTSFNLPISEQLKGARASRTTHPKVLDGYSRLLPLLLGKNISVKNPYLWKTKSEVVQVLKKAGLEGLVKKSVSCSHVRTTDAVTTHCGTCYQCVDRRFATLYNDLDEDDPPEIYQTDLFTGKLRTPDAKTMAESYVRFAKDVEDMTDLQFFERFGEAHRILKFTGIQSATNAAKELYSLYKRHVSQIASVIERQIRNLAEPIRKGEIRRDSLLGMVLGRSGLDKQSRHSERRFPAPEGAVWQDVKIDIKSTYHVTVTVAGESKVYTPFEMGFRDRRKIDELNLQWILLLLFADGGNRIGYGTPQQRPMIYKSVQALKKLLQDFFGLTESPIHNYRRGEGYVAKFYVTCADERLLDRIRNFEFSGSSDS